MLRRGFSLNLVTSQTANLYTDLIIFRCLGLVHANDEEGTRRRITSASKVMEKYGIKTEYGMGRTPPENFESISQISSRFSSAQRWIRGHELLGDLEWKHLIAGRDWLSIWHPSLVSWVGLSFLQMPQKNLKFRRCKVEHRLVLLSLVSQTS